VGSFATSKRTASCPGDELTPTARPSRHDAAITLFLARVVYAFNWYNVGAVLPLIGSGLGIGTARLGIVLGAFLAGAGIFQLPAGLAAIRWGNRRVCLTALVVMGAFALASAFSPNWIVLVGLRFGAGAGAAFFFAPALGLVSSYYPEGRRGPVIGLYNAGFSVGAGVGILAGAFVGDAYGWPAALAVGGVALFFAAGGAAFFLPRTSPIPLASSRQAVLGTALPLLRSRTLWALALGLMGLWASGYILAQYTVEFAVSVHPGWSLPVAAALPTLLILMEVAGGPFGGWLSERYRGRLILLVGWGVPVGAVVFLIPYVPIAALVAIFAFYGFGQAVAFANLYVLPSYLPGISPETLSFGLALINGIQILLGSACAIAFGFVAADYGYTAAWFFAGAISVATLPFLLGAKHLTRGGDRTGSSPLRTDAPPAS
jgi:predicted MFS family arabinose efflux permease